MGGIPATREWVSSMISKSLRAATGGGDKPPKALKELTDVIVTSPTDKQVLKYNASTNMWENAKDAGGTTVEANPEEDATEDLKKIKIGDKVYKIPEGGGSGGGYGVTVEDGVLKFSEGGSGGDSKHKYSTEEKVVGEWIDGKPVYEITYVLNDVYITDQPYTLFTDENILLLFDAKCIIQSTVNNNIYILPYTTGSGKIDMLRFQEGSLTLIGNDTWSGCNIFVTAQYTKTTD